MTYISKLYKKISQIVFIYPKNLYFKIIKSYTQKLSYAFIPKIDVIHQSEFNGLLNLN
jgi:hypothetical protein